MMAAAGTGICTNIRLRIAKVSHPPTLERMLYSEHTHTLLKTFRKKKLKKYKNKHKSSRAPNLKRTLFETLRRVFRCARAMKTKRSTSNEFILN